MSSLEINNIVAPDPNFFLWIGTSVPDAKPSGIKTLLVNGLNTFPIKGNPVVSNGPKGLPKTPPDCHIEFLIILY